MNIFIELTNPTHGGVGWEFGTCLWSPVKNSAGGDSWAIMRKPEKGDIIIHSYNTSSKPHKLQGLSIVDQKYYITDVEPSLADEWGGYGSYYRIELTNYTEFKNKKELQEFLDTYKYEIEKYHAGESISGAFYNRNIRVAQKYLEKVDYEIFKLILKFLGINNLNEFFSLEIKEGLEERKPETRNYIISRKIRDTKMSQNVKKEYSNICQICGKRINIGTIEKPSFYSEGAHIVPIGGSHNGSDTKDNLIVLCPNHHIEFDYGVITIDADTKKIKHVDNNNILNNKDLFYQRKDINYEYLKYHNERIYIG